MVQIKSVNQGNDASVIQVCDKTNNFYLLQNKKKTMVKLNVKMINRNNKAVPAIKTN